MTVATTLVVRVLVAMLALTAFVAQIAHLDALSSISLGLAAPLSYNPRPSFLTLVAADAVVSAVSAVLALALAFRGEPSRGARGMAVSLASWSYVLAYSGVVILLRPDPGFWRTVFDAHFPLVEILGLAGLVHFTAVFPKPLVPDHLSAADSLPVGLRTLQIIRMWLLGPAAPWIGAFVVLAALLGLNALGGHSLADAALNPIMDLVMFMAVGLVVLNLRRSWMASDGDDKSRMSWLLVGLALLVAALALLIGGNILMSATGWREPPVAWRPILLDLGLVGFLWGLAMVVSLDQTLGTSVRLGLQGFWKSYQGLETAPSETVRSSGIDLQIRSIGGRAAVWLGYGLSWFWSTEDLSGYASDFAGRHLLSAGISGDLSGPLRGEIRVGYGAGLPYTSLPFRSLGASEEVSAPIDQSDDQPQLSQDSPLLSGLDEEFLRIDVEIHALLERRLAGRMLSVRPYLRILNALDRRDALFYTFQPWRSDSLTPLAERPFLPILGVAFSF